MIVVQLVHLLEILIEEKNQQQQQISEKNPIEIVLFVCVKCVFASTQCVFALAKWICMNEWVSFYKAVIRNVNDAQEIIYDII